MPGTLKKDMLLFCFILCLHKDDSPAFTNKNYTTHNSYETTNAGSKGTFKLE